MKCPFCKREIAGAHVHHTGEIRTLVRIDSVRQEVVKVKTYPRGEVVSTKRVKVYIVKDWS